MKKSLYISQKYLLLPIREEETLKIVSFYDGETKVMEFEVPVGACTEDPAGDEGQAPAEKSEDSPRENPAPYAFHFYGAIPVEEWRGRRLLAQGDVPEAFLEAIAFSEEMPRTAHERPLIHFSADTGWLNDPNGLMFQDGLYHMFFQYNPCDTRWQNMSWGHAVSADLLHWEQKRTALLPDGDGPMYSGSAIVNERGLLGLPRDAKILFYTCAGGSSVWSKGKKYVQKIAYSTDGETFRKREGCVLEHVDGENRDPKVYWHEGKGVYYMVLFLDGYDYGIFNSTDLEHWEMTQRITLDKTRECPDLRRLPVEGGGSRWMFWGADGYYFLGDFDGSRFETDGVRHKAYQTMLPYAAQTFWGTERVIMVPWMRTDNRGRVYTSLMGVPRQLSLVKKGEDYILRQKLVDEFEESKVRVLSENLCAGKGPAAVPDEEAAVSGGPAGEEGAAGLTFRQETDAALEVKLFPEKGAGFTVNIYGTVCTMDPGSGRIVVEGVAERGRHIKGDSLWGYDKEQSAAEQIALERLAQRGVSTQDMQKPPKISPENMTQEEFLKAMEEAVSRRTWADAGLRVLETGQNPESISLLSDGEILEITINDGLVSDAFETAATARQGEVTVKASGTVKVEISRII